MAAPSKRGKVKSTAIHDSDDKEPGTPLKKHKKSVKVPVSNNHSVPEY